MTYPTREQIEAADHEQLCRWHRFLQSPGLGRVGFDDFEEAMTVEAKKSERIAERLKVFGGFTPEISKRIGWDQ